MNQKSPIPTITIIGSGYVGVTSAAIFANAGYKVYALEINPERLEAVKNGRSFFYEQYLNPLLEKAVNSGRLIGTDSYKKAIQKSDIVFSCVGTPDNPDGSSNLTYVMAAASETAKYAHDNLIYVQKSTVPVGTGERIERLFKDAKVNIPYVSNPEFLKEATAIIDSLWPDRVVAGGSKGKAVEAVIAIYQQVIAMREETAVIAEIPSVEQPTSMPEYFTTSRNSAELIKVSANAFLALKISFANSIAKLADAAGGDVVEIMDGIGADPRIGRAFLNAGRGYGGGCFPKDVSGLISSGLSHGVDLAIMRAARAKNDSMPGYILEKALSVLDNDGFAGKKVAFLGISFKAGTSDVRKSPALAMANLLSKRMNTKVYAYDPQAFHDENNKKHLHEGITIRPSIKAALRGCDIAIIATDWAEFIDIPPSVYVQHLGSKVVIDAMNCLDPAAIRNAGLAYVGVGR